MTPILRLADGQQVAVRDGMILGRVKCDVVIDDTKASRRHARIIAEAGVLEIEDLGSSNGTFLNGVQIDRKVLRPGDRIQIGRTVITLEEVAEAAETRPAARSPSARPAVEPRPAARAAADDDVDLLGDDDVPAGPADDDVDLLGDEDAPGAGAAAAATDDEDDLDLLSDRPAAPRPPRRPAVNVRPVRVSVSPPESAERTFELVEFEDEVVAARPTAREPAAARRSSASDEPEVVAPKRDVLQFQKKTAGRGPLGDDLAQLGGWQKFALVAVVLAAAVGVAYLAMNAVA